MKISNIRLTVAYDGTDYAGWQVQKNAKTVQGEIEKALKKIYGAKIRLIGAGRTDSGVHARAQIANFFETKKVSLKQLRSALNANLPKDISIVAVEKALPKFHARFDASGKVYRYTILNDPVSDPFTRNYCCRIPYRLDLSLMRKEAAVLLGRHDFKCFQRKSGSSPVKDTRRTIKKVILQKKGNLIHITIEADGFLHNMVRNVAGTLIEIGRGYFHKGSMRKILSSKDRTKAGPTAPAGGLTLIEVKY